MIGQTAEIAPADKFLYALRDATATVESIPLIAASIMSKKLAEGIDGLVLDVKTGGGAFMVKLEDSLELARAMCSIGWGLGKQLVALITRMDQPLGRAVGNAVEVAESLECLRGEGPDDLVELSIELAAEMVVMGGRAGSLEEARAICRRTIGDGSALRTVRPDDRGPGGRSPRDRRPGAPAGPAATGGPESRGVGICPIAGGAAGRARDHAARGRPGADG